MSDIKEQLIKLGAEQPGLQKHIKPVLDTLKSADWDDETAGGISSIAGHEAYAAIKQVLTNSGRLGPDEVRKVMRALEDPLYKLTSDLIMILKRM